MSETFKFDTLNTSYVNLAAFIRYLREQQFQGRLHIELDQYEGDIFLYGPDTPSAWEIDRATGREEQGDAAMQRLLVRARDPGGVIRVFENDDSKTPESSITDAYRNDLNLEKEVDPVALVAAAGELIAAVERAAGNVEANFEGQFHAARIELGDDYPFIDPTSGRFEYKDAVVTLDGTPLPSAIIFGVSGVLKRVVDSIARQSDESRFRELVAVELAVSARDSDSLGEFASQLDRIAGTRVL